MKKFYLLLLLVYIYSAFQATAFAQSILNPNDPIVEYDPQSPPVEPTYGQIGKWVRTKAVLWNSNSYKAYIYEGSCFRLKFPKSYNPTLNDGKKYPIALVFHGGGEAGPITDNETQLYHGGLPYMNAADSDKFDGYVMFMQSQGFWGTTSYVRVIDILNYMIINNKLDPFRISVNGLSSGGQASWDMVMNYPNYVGASLPMSNVSIGYKDPSVVTKVKFTPMWNFQGALDGSPSPSTAQQVRDAMVAAGANYRYLEYQDVGHGTWDVAFAEPDFFPFMLRAYSSNPWTLYGRTDFCSGSGINITLGVPPGFNSYQWRKDGVVISGAASNSLNVTSLGTYDARVLRGSTWSDWSHTPVVVQIKLPTVTPPIRVSGLMSSIIPSADGKNYVNLEVPDNGYTGYIWKKAGSDSVLSTQRIYTANQPGQYIAAVTEFYGCSSIYSAPFTVANANGQNPPPPATNLTASSVSSTQILLNWENNPHPLHNESAFEIYRSTSQNGIYSFAGKTPADTLKYTDSKLSPGINYFYKIRAVNDSGAAPLSNAAGSITNSDKTPPSAPGNLRIIYATNSSISIQWDSSADNVGVKNYQIYINGVKSYATSTNKFIINALQQGTVYSVYVKAVDSSGNYSTQSNIANSPAVLKGLLYKYYEGYWTVLPDFNSLTPILTGVSSNVSLAPAKRQAQLAFLWQGFINVPAAGTYKFQTLSDDGSKLWLNTYDTTVRAIVNNDGFRNSPKTRTGSIYLKKGVSPISIGYFQNKNSQVMQVSWSNPQFFGDTLMHVIEDKYFTSNYTPADVAPAVPDSVVPTAVSYNKMKITWRDKSSNEKFFQVYRSITSNSGYTIVASAEANITQYIDSNLDPFVKYFYKINAVNNYGTSAFTAPAWGRTLRLPSPPTAPGNLRAKALSSSSIQLTWNDLDSEEINYQVLRSVTDTFNYKLAALLPANSIVFNDTSLYGNTNYFYKVNTISLTSSSANKPGVTAKTKNTAPLILDKFSQKVVPYSVQTTIQIAALDSDADAVSLYAGSLPSFTGFTDNGNGTASLVLNPSAAQQGNYDSIKIYVKDTLNAQDSMIFRLTINGNYNPGMDSIADYTLYEGDSITLQLNASDLNAEDVLAWSVSGAPANYSFVPVSNGKINLTLNPGYTAAGVYKVQLTVNDGNGGTAMRQFNLTVNDKDPNVSVYLRFKDVDNIGTPWNNITSVTSSNFKDNLNRNTTIGLAMQTSWFATWHEGPQTGNNSGIYPDNVMKDYYYFGIFGGPETVTSKITGLDTLKNYSINFYGGSSWSGASDNGTTIYTIGSLSKSLHVQSNTTNTADFGNIKPASDGTITFIMSKAAGTPVGYINAIVIKYLYADTVKPGAPASLIATNVSGKGIQLSWADVAYNETNYNVYRALNAAGPFSLINGSLPYNSVSYFDSTVAGNTQYYYTVKASNAIGLSDSSNIAGVTTTNRVPVITPVSGVILKNNQQQTVNITATDDAADHVTLTAGNMPSFVTFTDNGNGTGVFNISPSSGITGTYENVTVTATDNSDSTSSASFNISVADQNLNSVYINFSSGSTASSPWNNFTAWPVANTMLTNLYDDNNSATGISMKLINGFQGYMTAGMQPGNNKGIYPEVVMRTGEYEGSTRIDSILISGLSSNKKYNFVFFNSHDDGLKAKTNFSINGQTISLGASHNINKTVQLNGITADTNGNVIIGVYKAVDADYAYLNSLVIQSYDSSQQLIAPGDLRVVGITKQSVTLQWSDRSSDETGFEIWRATDMLNQYSYFKTVPANTASFIDSNLNSGSTYYYTVHAVKTGLQSAFCNAVAATTYTQIIDVNFTFTNNASVPWNNTLALPDIGLTWNNFMDDTGIPSSISMQETGLFAGLYGGGVSTGDNSGIFPDKVLVDSYGLFTGETSSMKVSGLNLNMKYDFTFFASSQAYGDVNTAYTVNGKKVILNASLNTNGTVTMYDIAPDANGEVSIGIAPNTNTSQFGLLGALIIQEYSKLSGSIPAPPNSGNAFAVTLNNKKVQSFVSAPGKANNKAIVYPNPFIHDFTMALTVQKKDNVQAELYTINGKLILLKNFGELLQGSYNFRIVPEQDIASGIYLLKIIYTGSKRTEYIKILKQ